MDWQDRIELLDELVEEILQESGFIAPPIDAFRLADRLGVEIAIDSGQQHRGRYKRLAGRPSIFLKPEERPERLQWAAAHELGEFVAHRYFERSHQDVENLAAGQREQIANLLAARILLPRRLFFDDSRQLQGDLIELKKIYSTASYELIALRLLDLPEQSMITIFDQGQISRRQSNCSTRTPQLQPVEKECWEPVHFTNQPIELRENGLLVRGWPIHEDGWKREILRTVPTNEYSEW